MTTPNPDITNKEEIYLVITSNNKIKSVWVNRDDMLEKFKTMVLNTCSSPEIPITSTKLNQFITVTNNYDDRIKVSDLGRIKYQLQLTSKKLKEELVLLGAKYDNKHGLYKGVKFIE